MSIRILCPGKTRDRWISEGIDEYLKRIRTWVPIELIELADISTDLAGSVGRVKVMEAEIIARALPSRGRLIALDERGRQFDSVEFAGWLDGELTGGNLNFVIGGVYGLDQSLLDKADLKLGFSRFTFTHRMIRLLLVEQLYRALTIIRGKKYHY